ncbi:hypothetical protein ACWGH8_34795 [Nonomuraea muscovyensis]|uniref:Acetyltransferase n=1 Tax=Nonomuraea muscovyensis TaxID=1124761 RepID=A0A7X0EU51_9ACTN|nr:hypothetical protein [Nonomuraea muscovyensis]MBB6344387.1 hypothetical protein [Nonomuraea muscovyensis]
MLPAIDGVRLERCATGHLREAYPAGAHDVEVRVSPAVTGEAMTRLLQDTTDAVARADPACRRLVCPVPEGDLDRMAAAESAGYRYVVDVDLPGEQLSLLVHEPDWVTRTDMDLGHVPGS